MKAIKVSIVFIAMIVMAVVIGSFFISPNLHVEYKYTIQASPERVYQQIAELRNWDNWSYWKKIDTTIRTIYSERSDSSGAYYTWTSSNPEVGAGKLTISKVKDNEYINTEIIFKDWGDATTNFLLKENNGNTEVLCVFDTKMEGVANKWIGVLIMKSQIIKSFESCMIDMNSYLSKK